MSLFHHTYIEHPTDAQRIVNDSANGKREDRRDEVVNMQKMSKTKQHCEVKNRTRTTHYEIFSSLLRSFIPDDCAGVSVTENPLQCRIILMMPENSGTFVQMPERLLAILKRVNNRTEPIAHGIARITLHIPREV